jgi:hypothetical protein
MREHGFGPFGRADVHPRRNPLDRQGRFAPQPAAQSLKSKVQSPKLGWESGLLPALAQRRERSLTVGLRPAVFHLPFELQTSRCGVPFIAGKFDVAGFAHGASWRFSNRARARRTASWSFRSSCFFGSTFSRRPSRTTYVALPHSPLFTFSATKPDGSCWSGSLCGQPLIIYFVEILLSLARSQTGFRLQATQGFAR